MLWTGREQLSASAPRGAEPPGFTGGPRRCPRCSHPLPADGWRKFPEAETKRPRVRQSLRSRGSNVGRLSPDVCRKLRGMLPYKAVYVSFRWKRENCRPPRLHASRGNSVHLPKALLTHAAGTLCAEGGWREFTKWCSYQRHLGRRASPGRDARPLGSCDVQSWPRPLLWGHMCVHTHMQQAQMCTLTHQRTRVYPCTPAHVHSTQPLTCLRSHTHTVTHTCAQSQAGVHTPTHTRTHCTTTLVPCTPTQSHTHHTHTPTP